MAEKCPHDIFSGYGKSRYPGFDTCGHIFTELITYPITDVWNEKSVHKILGTGNFGTSDFICVTTEFITIPTTDFS